MRKITISNEKGGVGKTTVGVTVAAGLAARGKRVLLIDAEEQGHATLAVGIGKYPGLYDLLVRDATFRRVLRAVDPAKYGGEGKTNLYLLGSNVETRNIAGSISDALKFKARLAEIEETFDYAIIDTAPTPSLLHGSIYLATDGLIIPTELEFLSLDGLTETLRRAKAHEMHGSRLAVLGIVPNKYRVSTLEHRENLAALRGQFGDLVWPPVGLSIVWSESANFALPIFVHAPEHEASLAAWEMVDRIEEWDHVQPTQR